MSEREAPEGQAPVQLDPPAAPPPPGASRWRVPLSDVRLPPAAVAAARTTLESGWLSSGPRVREFEEEMAAYVGTRHAVACSSGTAAVELAYAALELGDGDEIAMPSLTFVAGANAARLRGAEPVFCDVIGDDDLTIDPESIRRVATDRTRAVVLMHYGGHPCRPEVLEAARDQGLVVIEDAAHALGSSGPPGPCGSWGDVGCFSFFANKNLPLGEGGMLVTDDSELAERALRLRSHGMTTATWERHTGAAPTYDVRSPAHNFRFDEARAAMGSVMLRELSSQDELRGGLSARYRELLDGVDGVAMPFASRGGDERSAHHLAVAALDRGLDRDAVADRLRAAGVQTSVHYPPTHRFGAHRGARADVARTDDLADHVITLPLFPHMEPGQVDLVCELLAEAVAGG
jgi:dTDP-4-amino-4,6-dideoxygalactose transaminase